MLQTTFIREIFFMSELKKANEKNRSVRGLLFSALFSVLVILSLSMIAALICNAVKADSGLVRLYSLGALVLSAFVSGFVNSKRVGVSYSLFSGLLVSLIMLMVGIIISSGKLSAGAFMNYGCFFLVSIAGAYLGKMPSSKKRRRRR